MRLRVLVLSYETPAHPAAGGPSRQANLLAPLAARHDIRVVSTGGPPPFGDVPAGLDVCYVDPGDLHPFADGWVSRNLGHYLRGAPWIHETPRHHRVALSGVLREQLADFRPDVVQVEHGELGPLVTEIDRPVVLVLHNLLASVQLQRALDARGRRRLAELLDVPIAITHERGHMLRATRVVVTTEADRHVASRMARRARVAVVPNCVDVAYWSSGDPPAPVQSVVMTASFHYPPNAAAARELITDVFPLVRAALPDAELVLVGQGMSDDLSRLVAATPGVRATGGVDDVRPFLRAARVALAPLRRGSGSPLKVMEALAAGVPVVATSRVTAALGVAEADGVVAADGGNGMAAAVVSLLRDDGRRDALAAAAAAAASRFDRGPASAAQERVWLDAVQSRPGNGA